MGLEARGTHSSDHPFPQPCMQPSLATAPPALKVRLPWGQPGPRRSAFGDLLPQSTCQVSPGLPFTRTLKPGLHSGESQSPSAWPCHVLALGG